MKESSTYQAILEEGRQEGRQEGRSEGALIEAKKFLRIIGDVQFGPPDAQTAQDIEGIKDVARLENLASRLREAKSWQELLHLPAANPRRRRHR